MTKFGILLERQAEMVTDGLRALLLEDAGYATKLFEFISIEHTHKNIMITGVKRNKVSNRNRILSEIRDLKLLYGIHEHHLEHLLFTPRAEAAVHPNDHG